MLEEVYLTSIRKQFLAYKTLGEKAIAQLTDAELLFEPGPESNSIAIIIRHLHGNMRSRFTNFLSEDGEKPWRRRDEEFISPGGWHPPGEIKASLLNLWQEGWDCVLGAIDQVGKGQLLQTITIRQEPHTVLDACNRQLAHYSAHIGQIIFIAKLIKGKDWITLSIPKGGSDRFNQSMEDKSGSS